jgi:hypothetical protein
VDADKKTQDIVDWAKDAKSLSDGDKIGQIYSSLPPAIGSSNLRKVLAVSILPEARDWTITRKAAAASIKRDTWYRIIKTPTYRAANVTLAKMMLSGVASQIMTAFIENALSGDSRAQVRALEDLEVLRAQQSLAGAVSPIQVNIGVNIVNAPVEERLKFREGYATAFKRGHFSDN